MKNNTKRIITALLAAGMLAACVGCGTPGENPAGSDPGSTPAGAYTPTDTAGVYAFTPAEGEVGEMTDYRLSDGILLERSGQGGMDGGDTELTVYDLATGTVLCRKSLTGNQSQVDMLDGGGFAVTDQVKGTFTGYDKTGKEIFAAARTDDGFISRSMVSADGTLALFCDREGKPHLMEIATGAEIALAETDEPLYINEILDSVGGAFLFTDMQNTLYRVDKAGEPTDIHARRDAHLVGPYIVETTDRGYLIRTTASGSLTFFSADVDGEYATAAADGYFISTLRDERLRIYDVAGNRATDPIALPGMFRRADAANGVAVVTYDDDGTYTPYILRLDELDYPIPLTLGDAQDASAEDSLYAAWTGDPDTVALAQKILDDYGVRVGFRLENEADKQLFYYDCGDVDPDSVIGRLRDIDEFLALYPREMLTELADGREIWLSLCSDISDPDTERKAAIGGFATSICGYPLVAIDVGGSKEFFLETLAHEFTHLTDRRMSAEDLAAWEAMSPADAYVMSYTAAVSNRYTPFDGPGKEVYFINQYARTFPTEDRAVIGEKLFHSYFTGETDPVLTENPHVREKAETLCKLLRKNFPCLAKAENLYWESPLHADN